MAKRIGILGSGMVGRTLGKGFLNSGYDVMIGTRDINKLDDWKKTGDNALVGSFEKAAKFGEVIVLATKWTGAENAVKLAGKENFADKTVIDVTNPLLFESENEPPKMALGYPDSAGETVQKWLHNAKVVKAFNTVTAAYMTNAKLEEGIPDLFICGNDAGAKKTVTEIANQWGWRVTDIGDIKQSYLLEALAMLWIRYGFLNNHWTHAFKLLRK